MHRLLVAAPRLARPASALATRPNAMLRGSLQPQRVLSLRLLSTESGDAAKADAEAKADGEEAAAATDAPADGAEASADVASDGDGSSVETLQAKIAELEEQVAAKHDQVLRALAEAENARRRASIDVEKANKFAVGKFAKSLLDVADNLSRAAESVPEEMRASEETPVLKGLYDGVVMTETTLVKAFEENGMKKLWPIDEKFDPNIHNALFEMPDPNKEPGTVMHVASAGYVLHDRCIRPAGVGVVSKPA